MASDFNVLSSKFFDQIVNDFDFSGTTTSFNPILKGNTGDIIKLTQRIQVSTSYNLTEDKTCTLDSLFSITCFDDWYVEGFYPTANVRVEASGGGSTNITILSISGVGNSRFTISSAHATAINALGIPYDEGVTTIIFKLISVPTYINYKYGLNPVGYTGESYQSPLDTNIQCYYSNTIPLTPTTATGLFLGAELGADLGSMDVSFITTDDLYHHQIEINHTFKIPYYISGQIPNLEGVIAPEDYTGTNTYRYDNRYELGTPTYHNSVFVNFGTLGSVGYFNQNFNGLVNDYVISELSISNASGSGVLESTEVNAVYFKVTSSTDNFQSGINVIMGHSKLPTTDEYQNKLNPYNDIWLFETLLNVEGAGTTSDTIITDLEVNIDTSKVLEVECNIQFTALQQLKIDTGKNYLLWFTVANKDLADSEIIDRVNLVVDVNGYSKNKDISGLLTNNDTFFYPSWSAFTGTKYSNFTGGDGDIWGAEVEFKMLKTANTKIIGANFKVLASNGSNTMELSNTYFPIFPIEETFDGLYNNQVLNLDIANNINIPETDPLNRLIGLIEASIVSMTEQDAYFRCGFQTPWRDWVENLNISMEFYDITKPNNNRNLKTSNYSGLLSYVIYGVWEFQVSNNTYPDTPTVYQIYSSPTTIIDFDSAFWSMTSADTTLETLSGDPVFEISVDEDLIVKIKFTHALGVLALNTLDGFVWIERDTSTIAPWYLATHSDWTSEDNWLQPSDTLVTGNYQFVEVISVSNLVTFVFKTKAESINISDITSNIYGKIWKK